MKKTFDIRLLRVFCEGLRGTTKVVGIGSVVLLSVGLVFSEQNNFGC